MSGPDHSANTLIPDWRQEASAASPGTVAGGACDRGDLARWSARGGSLPSALAAHVVRCRGCARRVRLLNQVNASMTLLQSQSLPAGMMYEANKRALRMLRRTVRASQAARHALRARPGLSAWQRIRLQLARGAMGAAAAVLVLVMRAGVWGGLEQTRAAGEALAQSHWDRHIDPDNEWFESEG